MRESLEQGLLTQRAGAVSVCDLHQVDFYDGSRLSVKRVRVVLDNGESLGVFFKVIGSSTVPFGRDTAMPPALAARCCASRVDGAVYGESGVGSGS